MKEHIALKRATLAVRFMTKKATLTKREHIDKPELGKGRGSGNHCISVNLDQVFSMFLYDLFAIADSEGNVRHVPATRHVRTRRYVVRLPTVASHPKYQVSDLLPLQGTCEPLLQ